MTLKLPRSPLPKSLRSGRQKNLHDLDSNAKAYKASYNTCEPLHDRVFKELKLTDLQGVVDNCGKNYPTLHKLKVLFSQMYEYAMKYEICMKDYSEYVDITKFKDKNPNKTDRSPFSK